jgi:hypothetical protein
MKTTYKNLNIKIQTLMNKQTDLQQKTQNDKHLPQTCGEFNRYYIHQ